MRIKALHAVRLSEDGFIVSKMIKDEVRDVAHSAAVRAIKEGKAVQYGGV
jgi:hypothetical protein